MRTDLSDLRATLEQLRKVQHPELSADLVNAVIDAEAANPDDDTSALREVRRAVEEGLQHTRE